MCTSALDGSCVELELTPRSVFVNGRPRPAIMEDMRRRIARGDIKQERAEAIKVNLHAVTWDELINTVQGNV
jgi:hypothetical protein